MIYLSHFEPDGDRFGEFLACLWQGPVPNDLRLHKWLYLAGEPRRMVVLWEGEAAAVDYMERAFGGFGTLSSESVTEDATPGLAAALDRDLDGFGDWMRVRGATDDQINHALDVRRRGRDAPDQTAAAEAGRAWAAGSA